MPFWLIIGAIAAVLLSVVGISLFGWRVYSKVGAGPFSWETGLRGPGGDQTGPAGPKQPLEIPWIPLALAGLGAALILRA